MDSDTIAALFARHGVRGSWRELPAHGIANYIYATDGVVLRVATDHPEALGDARTEVVAAPVARAAGIRAPQLLGFGERDGRPYSLWERVHAATLCELAAPPPSIWRELGAELALLHDRVRECPDPNGWLDRPGRDDGWLASIPGLIERRLLARDAALLLLGWADQLRPALDHDGPRRFLHDDAHAGNVMCTSSGALVALIDWGDAGWGDPALELASVPFEAVPYVVSGYEAQGGELGGDADARILFDQIRGVVNDLDAGVDNVAAFIAWARGAEPRWRRLAEISAR